MPRVSKPTYSEKTEPFIRAVHEINKTSKPKLNFCLYNHYEQDII